MNISECFRISISRVPSDIYWPMLPLSIQPELEVVRLSEQIFRDDKWGKRKRVSGCTIMRTNCGSIDSSNEIRLISGAACLTL